ncbi:MAG: F0F1 ATP synthase subunit A [Clostridiales bacterium]|nr:F0F1 ATP synthase subunit A [Clostridiales bacterium]
MRIGKQKVALISWLLILAALLIGVFLTGSLDGGETESVQVAMKDAVLHDVNQISLFGIKDVNPGLISAFTVTAVLLILAALLRIFVIPRFQLIPGKLQLLLEQLVGMFDGMAKRNSPWRNRALGAYLFAAASYIFVGTCFELFGLQVVTTGGNSIALPAPLSDINGAIALGCLSYLFIMSGGIAGNGVRGIGRTLKEFSLPISMSFRLFGALLSGLLVTELVYYYINLSFVLPVVVGVLFTLLHALIQSYVLTMLTALYYGEVSEPGEKKPKKAKKKRSAQAAA